MEPTKLESTVIAATRNLPVILPRNSLELGDDGVAGQNISFFATLWERIMAFGHARLSSFPR